VLEEKEGWWMKFKDKVALVTGAGRGIGRAIAINLAKEGSSVGIVDIDGDLAKKLSKEIETLGGVKAVAIQADVSNFEEVKKATQLVVETLGDIDILVNNAGGTPAGMKLSPVCEKPESDWDAMIRLNLTSVYSGCRAVIERMIERRSGKIVNIASVGGMVGISGSSDYCAAKAGVIGFTKALAKEVAQYGINVNSVSPGPIATELFMELSTDAQKKRYKDWTGFNRFGKPEDIAYTVTFLASDEASFITGQNHAVCGLRDLGGPDVS
jgi:NAD(P)-dependent dehydrogenase (short-subunit alcohol dehydrogenase family)